MNENSMDHARFAAPLFLLELLVFIWHTKLADDIWALKHHIWMSESRKQCGKMRNKRAPTQSM
jgi:hypothetical protein